jgi:hypothetical protein
VGCQTNYPVDIVSVFLGAAQSVNTIIRFKQGWLDLHNRLIKDREGTEREKISKNQDEKIFMTLRPRQVLFFWMSTTFSFNLLPPPLDTFSKNILPISQNLQARISSISINGKQNVN